MKLFNKNMKSIYLLTLIPTLGFGAQSTAEKLEELELRLGDLEINQALSKFRFGGTFTSQLEYYSRAAKNTGFIPNVAPINAARGDSTDTQLKPGVMKIEFNVDANISRTLNFYSTIGMAKFMNLSDRNKRNERDTGGFMSFAGSNNYKDSTAHFDMAYVTYNGINSPWTFAAGRMPTNNGVPLNQADGIGRSGTYPALSFNVILDGFGLVYDFRKMMPKDQSFKMRFFYNPFNRIDKDDKATQETDTNGQSGEPVESHAVLSTLMAEYSKRNLSWAKKLDVFFSTYHIDKFYSESQQKYPEGTFGGAADYLENDGVEYFDATSHTLYLGIDELANTRLTTSFTYTHYNVKYAGEEFLSDNYLVTLNYQFDNNLNARDILGVEYLHTDENRVPTEESTLFINDFYNMINGEGYHVYYTRVIDANQSVRLGYFNYTTDESKFLINDLKTKEYSTYLRWKVVF